MKCDELTPIDLECNMGKDINGVEHREPWKAYDIDEVNDAIAELKQKIEDAKDTAYADSVDAGMRERRLKRALWLTRAERAIAEQTIDEWSRYREKHPLGSWRVDPFDYWVNAWINVEKLCRKKAEEYK